MMDKILENRLLGNLAKQLAHPDYQKNRLHESDAELIQLPGLPGKLLAVTIDTLEEEIAYGLYTDPVHIGWMAVIVNLSDLAAVGATPMGLVISTTFAEKSTDAFRAGVMTGIQQACTHAHTFILGGDTNFAAQTHITACALGLVDEKLARTRLGCQAGDHVFVSGPLGDGNAFALAQLGPLPPEIKKSFRFQPCARIREAAVMARYASACIDSSDGFIAAVDQLMRLNAVGFLIDCDWHSIVSPAARQLCRMTHTPPWLMLAGYHGEFELVFAIPARDLEAFITAARRDNWQPIHVGRVLPEPEIKLRSMDHVVSIDSARIRNLFAEVDGDVQEYIMALNNMGKAYNFDAAVNW